MNHRFGDFALDQSARSLTLRGEAQPLQPRIFDLLCYFVAHAGRVIPKDELLDALWPGVTVTESSLQRAVSLLRRTLSSGGLGRALQNFQKHGYRFAIDEPSLGTLAPSRPAAGEILSAARDAANRRDWGEASALFARAFAAQTPVDAEDLELWALADECRGRPVHAIPALSRAVEAHLAAGRKERAARAAVTLAKIELERGAGAPAQGWLDRAESLLVGTTDTSAHAYLLWMRARSAGGSARPDEALAFAARANDLAEEAGDQGLRALTLVYRGFYNLSVGNIAEGNRLQNHAAAIALSSRVDPITGSLVYCNILWACRTFADWERGLQWSDGFEAWCISCFPENPGSCDLHRAEILGARGTLGEAFARISNALEKLRDEEAWSLGEGHRVRGDIAAMAGDISAAEADYAAAYALGWDAEPGNAVLLFEKGNPAAALSALDRALEGHGWFHLQRRGILLANAARIAALSGQATRAERHLAELAAAGDRWPQPAIRALIAETRAALLPPDDPAATQLRLLARQVWTSAKLDYQAARIRLDLAARSLAAGDRTAAEAELSAADHTARRIGSTRLLDATAALRARIAAHTPVAGSTRITAAVTRPTSRSRNTAR